MRRSQTDFFLFRSPSQGLDLTASVFPVGTISSCVTPPLNLGAIFTPWLLLLLLPCPLQPALQPSGHGGLCSETDQGSPTSGPGTWTLFRRRVAASTIHRDHTPFCLISFRLHKAPLPLVPKPLGAPTPSPWLHLERLWLSGLVLPE